MLATKPLDLDLHLSSPPTPAEAPPEARGLARDAVRLLVLDKRTGTTTHARFFDLPDFLSPGDVLVVNTSATIPAKLCAKTAEGSLQIHLATKLSEDTFIVERRTANGGPDRRKFAKGERIEIIDLASGRVAAVVETLRQFHPDSRLWVVKSDQDLFEIAHRIGFPIRYSYVKEAHDVAAYQTVFARTYGSAEMPSASRPFTHQVLKRLAARGVKIRSLILHTGVSSHEVERDLEHHPVLPEWYHIPAATAVAVNQAKAAGHRIIAVGTTVIRALESAVMPNGEVLAGSNWTIHLVTPETPPRIVSGLITGMHESQSSHLALLYSFVKPEMLRRAYEEAVRQGYLWHEFGDSNLIL
jgi:S-adenosylmethionine:tRNA ribosyltransferase-isomerase